MKIIVAFFMFLLPFGVTSQQDTLIDKNYEELTTILRASLQDSATAIRISNYYIEKAQKESELVREAEGIHALSLIYYQQQDALKSAVEMDRLLAFIALHKLDSFKIRAYQLAGGVYLSAAQIQKSLDINKELLELAEAKGDETLKKQAITTIDFIESMGGENEAFIKKYKKQLEALTNNPSQNSTLEELNTQKMRIELLIGDAYFKMKKGDSSVFYIRKALQKSLASQDSCTTKAIYTILGAAEILINDFSSAKKSLDYTTKYCRPITRFDSLLLGSSYSKIAYKQGNYQQAIDYMEQALQTYEVSEAGEAYMDDFYMILADSHKELGNLEKANTYFQKHVHTTTQFDKVQDSIQLSIRQKEQEKFQAELTQLLNEKAKKETSLNYILLIGSIVILILLFFLLKFYRNKKQNEIKFNELLAKIKAAETPAEIINTKDILLQEKEINDVPDDTKQLILNGLKKLEEKEYFLKQECSSYNVAKKIGTNTSYLSKTINAHYSKNFNTYINDLRINYAIVRIKNDVLFRSYSIQSIAEEVGYKSADSFTKYFKKDTGLNPSFYIKNIKNIA